MDNLFDKGFWAKISKSVYGFDYVNVGIGEIGKKYSFTIINFPVVNYKKMICMPYVAHSNIELEGKQRTCLDFEKFIIETARDRKIRIIEIRSREKLPLDWQVSTKHVTFLIDLTNGYENLFNKMHNNVRTAIRKGYKNNLKHEFGLQLFDGFYSIYSRSVKKLGTPVHSENFFREILKTGYFNILTVFTSDGTPISSVLFGFDETTLYPLWGGGLADYRDLSGDNFKYWELVKYACERNFNWFDFGRSTRGSGTAFFKSRWASEERQLYYYFYDTKRTLSVQKSKNYLKNDLLESFFIKTWSKFPLFLTNFLGPHLRKYIP